MVELLGRLDVWLALITLALMGYFLVIEPVWDRFGDLVAGWMRDAWRSRRTRDAADYVTQHDSADDHTDTPFSPFERAERPSNVQPVRNLNGPPELIDGALDDITRAQVKRLASLYEAGQLTAISALSIYFGVAKGGSKLYQALTEELKQELARRGRPLDPNPRQPIERKPISGLPQPHGVTYAGELTGDE
jgi:hypothetical protein